MKTLRPSGFFRFSVSDRFVAMQVLHVIAEAGPGHALVGIDAIGGFDLDDVGAEIRQHPTAGRAGADAAEVEDAQMRKGHRGRG